MKKLSLVLAAVGLLAVAACKPSTQTPAENATDNAVETLDNMGDSLENAADSTSNETVAATLDNAADVARGTADNIAANAM